MIGTRSGLVALGFLFCAVGCGSTPAPVEAPVTTAEPPPEASAAPKVNPDAPFGSVPTACDDTKDGACLPPAKFVKRLCSSFYPEVALAMFSKGTPWTRGYLKGNVEAWNASGGSSSSDKLVFDEEVLVVRRRSAATGGMQVSGAGGGYDVLRWDGTCASLQDEELTLKAPPTKPKFAKIPFKSLEDKLKSALESDDKVGKAIAARRKECKGATIGDVSIKCVKADDLVSVVIVDFVRGGGSIPAPAKVP